MDDQMHTNTSRHQQLIDAGFSVVLDSNAIKKIPEIKYKGRPTKFEEKYCQMLVEHCAHGGHISDFCTQIGVSQSTVFLWLEKHRAFKEAANTAQAYSLRFYSKIGTLGMMGQIKGFNSFAWAFMMRNKFHDLGFGDRADANNTPMIAGDGEKITVEFVDA